MQRKTHLDGIAVSLLVVCCLFWGAQQVLIKTTLAELPPFFQASLRFIGATVLLMLWCKWRNIPLNQHDFEFLLSIESKYNAVNRKSGARIFVGVEHKFIGLISRRSLDIKYLCKINYPNP